MRRKEIIIILLFLGLIVYAFIYKSASKTDMPAYKDPYSAENKDALIGYLLDVQSRSKTPELLDSLRKLHFDTINNMLKKLTRDSEEIYDSLETADKK